MVDSSILVDLAEFASTDTGLVATLGLFAFVGLGVLDNVFGSNDSDDDKVDNIENTDDGGSLSEIADSEEENLGDDPFSDGDFNDQGFNEGGNEDELENRVDQLEEELSSLSSTVSTVRTENEQISESVEEIEENIRKLLDIYKMVTKGVNPFVDEQGGGVAGEVDSGSLGIFDDEGSDTDDEIDNDMMETEAQEFFADDIEEDGSERGKDEPDSSSFDSSSSNEPEDDVEFETLDDSSGTHPSESGPESSDENRGIDAEQVSDSQESESDSLETEETRDSKLRKEANASSTSHEDASQRQIKDEATEATPNQITKPYLEELPPGYAEDLIVLEWIDFLVEKGDFETAQNALRYYEEIDWIGPQTLNQLQVFLKGHPDARKSNREGRPPEGLSVDDHTQSLQYIARLNGAVLTSSSPAHRDLKLRQKRKE